MSLGKIIISGVIASIGIFVTSVIQNQVLEGGGLVSTVTGSEILVAPAIVGAAVFVAVLGKLQHVQV